MAIQTQQQLYKDANPLNEALGGSFNWPTCISTFDEGYFAKWRAQIWVSPKKRSHHTRISHYLHPRVKNRPYSTHFRSSGLALACHWKLSSQRYSEVQELGGSSRVTGLMHWPTLPKCQMRTLTRSSSREVRARVPFCLQSILGGEPSPKQKGQKGHYCGT